MEVCLEAGVYMQKTNAMRLLDQEQVVYQPLSYDISDGQLDGVTAADRLGLTPEEVFKTLVTVAGRNYYVFVIPVAEKLDLKKAARACGEKKLDMLAQKDLKPLTGYIHGGCSPLAMKKLFPSFIDESALLVDRIAVSAGQIGHQVFLDPQDLAGLIGAKFTDLLQF